MPPSNCCTFQTALLQIETTPSFSRTTPSQITPVVQPSRLITQRYTIPIGRSFKLRVGVFPLNDVLVKLQFNFNSQTSIQVEVSTAIHSGRYHLHLFIIPQESCCHPSLNFCSRSGMCHCGAIDVVVSKTTVSAHAAVPHLCTPSLSQRRICSCFRLRHYRDN